MRKRLVCARSETGAVRHRPHGREPVPWQTARTAKTIAASAVATVSCPRPGAAVPRLPLLGGTGRAVRNGAAGTWSPRVSWNRWSRAPVRRPLAVAGRRETSVGLGEQRDRGAAFAERARGGVEHDVGGLPFHGA